MNDPRLTALNLYIGVSDGQAVIQGGPLKGAVRAQCDGVNLSFFPQRSSAQQELLNLLGVAWG